MLIINGIVFILIFFFAVIVFFLAIQIICAIAAPEKSKPFREKRKNVAILIPAHNEESVIAETLQSIIPQLLKNDRIIVIADNCDDNTANIASKEGAKVIIRNNKTERGKGYALSFGIEHLKEDPPEILIIIDADCIVQPNAIEQLSIYAAQINQPVQSLNLMHHLANASIKQKIQEFAFLIKNYVRPLGMKMMGLPCQLMGTGMVFPWHCLSNVDLSNGNIVEDMALGIDLIEQGYTPTFFPYAGVKSFFPGDQNIAEGQKTRWEHGHLDLLLKRAPRTLFKGILKQNYKQILFALDIMILPLALLSTLLFLMFAVVFLISLLAESNLFLLNATSSILLIFTVSILLAWAKFGRSVITIRELLTVPFYILSKVTIYFHFFTDKQKSWVKTKRDNEKTDDV